MITFRADVASISILGNFLATGIVFSVSVCLNVQLSQNSVLPIPDRPSFARRIFFRCKSIPKFYIISSTCAGVTASKEAFKIR